MSVLIKGMKIPVNCTRCPCSNDETRFCMAKQEYIPMLGKPDFCPLIELPENHGRLIDADELLDKMRCSNWSVSFSHDGIFLDISEFADIIRNIETVIEAEGEG